VKHLRIKVYIGIHSPDLYGRADVRKVDRARSASTLRTKIRKAVEKMYPECAVAVLTYEGQTSTTVEFPLGTTYEEGYAADVVNTCMRITKTVLSDTKSWVTIQRKWR
jgi:hypothetical protein